MRRWILPLALTAATAAGLLAASVPAEAKGKAKPVVISVGDSYISGEAGRWAGNSSGAYSAVDALGPTAYFDNPARTAELIPDCHRAAMSPIHFSADVVPVNLACSGALATTSYRGSSFKPGLDFYDDGKGHRGQAALLRDAATGADVQLVAVSIGANNFNFLGTATQCVSDFLASSSILPDYCLDDRTITKRLTPAAVAHVQASIVTGLHNIRTAMREAGHRDGSYDIVVLTYPSAVSPGPLLRYPEAGYTRLTTGGCPLWDRDATWFAGPLFDTFNSAVRGAVADADVQGLHLLDNAGAFVGHRLCENTVRRLDETTLSSWQSTGAVDQMEWMQEIRTVSTLVGPYNLNEGIHPNYWGQRAVADCLALAWNKGKVRGGTCTLAGPGLVGGNPVMQLR